MQLNGFFVIGARVSQCFNFLGQQALIQVTKFLNWNSDNLLPSSRVLFLQKELLFGFLSALLPAYDHQFRTQMGHIHHLLSCHFQKRSENFKPTCFVRKVSHFFITYSFLCVGTFDFCWRIIENWTALNKVFRSTNGPLINRLTLSLEIQNLINDWTRHFIVLIILSKSNRPVLWENNFV